MIGAPKYLEELTTEYQKKKYWLGLTVADMLDRTCDTYPEREAVICGSTKLKYRDLKLFTNKLALVLYGAGLKKGDVVLLQLPNSVEFILAYYALSKIGAIPVMCLTRFGVRDVNYFADLTEAKAWIGILKDDKRDYSPIISSLGASREDIKLLLFDQTDIETEIPKELREKVDIRSLWKAIEKVEVCTSEDEELLLSLRPSGDDVAHLMPTGGTTGFPKLVPRTHNSYVCNIEFRAKACERSPRDITLIATPLAHNMAIEWSLNPTVYVGGKVVIETTATEAILEAIQKEKVTTMILVPTQLRRLLDHPDFGKCDLSSLKVVAGAGQHVPREIITEIIDRIGCKFFNVFGMSEGPCTQTRLDDPLEVVLDTVGKPICPYDEFRILNENGEEVEAGREGELAARGPCIFAGYYKAEEENLKVFTSDGFFLTGDLARFDENGNIVITGRKKDIIIRGGENISAGEVEKVVSMHPKVAEVAAVGMPDRVMGERVCVFLKLKPGETITLDELAAFLKEKEVSVLYWPERIEIIDEMPLTGAGKIDKKRLKDVILSKLETESPPEDG